MNDNWREVVGNWLLRQVPLVISVLWLIISFIPLHSEIYANARPMVGVICVYFWLVYCPDFFNLSSVFFFGLISDVLSLNPLGSSLFMYLITYVAVTNLVKYVNDKTFEIVWIGLIIFLPMVMLAGWAILSLYYGNFLPVKGLFFSYLLSIALYPVIGGINALVVNRFLQEDS